MMGVRWMGGRREKSDGYWTRIKKRGRRAACNQGRVSLFEGRGGGGRGRAPGGQRRPIGPAHAAREAGFEKRWARMRGGGDANSMRSEIRWRTGSADARLLPPLEEPRGVTVRAEAGMIRGREVMYDFTGYGATAVASWAVKRRERGREVAPEPPPFVGGSGRQSETTRRRSGSPTHELANSTAHLQARCGPDAGSRTLSYSTPRARDLRARAAWFWCLPYSG